MSLVTYKSSAGSGKTSTLVIEYLCIALKKPHQFHQIIALTFTQKATAEMKERLIEYLILIKDMNVDNPADSISYVVKAISQKTTLNYIEIKQKSKILLTNILHNYGDFGFSTIDSFVVRIVRSFAHDLQLSSNFEIELDSNILIEEAIGELNELIGENDEITKFMIDFTLDQLDEEKSPDLDKPLATLGKLIFDSKHYANIDSLKEIPLKNFADVKEYLIKKLKKYDNTIRSFGEEGFDCTQKNGLSKGDCSSSWLWNYFNKLKTNDKQTYSIKELEKKTIPKMVDEGADWYAKSKDSVTKESIDNAKSEFLEIIYRAREFYAREIPRYNSNRLILQKITPLALIHQLKQIIEANYEENDIIHLSEVNRKISEIVNEQHAPFIYERIGQRYNHFLIDEFQDTSVIQWNNMLPLIDNSLASNFRNLLVGDTKQSIYRWRDGEVEQFAKLPNLLGDNKSVITKQRESLLKAMYEEVILDTNYRSKENIVNFNNEIFTVLLNDEDDYVKSFFENHIQKSIKEYNSGVVKLHNIPKNKDQEYKNEDLINSIIKNIENLTNNQNYNYGDICILARKNKFLSELADKLIDSNIKVYSSDALYLISSNTISIIISFMNIVIDKDVAINSYSALRYFYKKENMGEPTESVFSKESFFSKLLDLGYEFDLLKMESMDAYELSEYVISNIKLDNLSNPFLYNFLDRIIDLSKKKGINISLFIEYWDENKHKLKIDLAPDKDSVQLLTIHRAKGLEFPVVFFPMISMAAELSGKDMLWVEPDEIMGIGVPKVLIGDYKYGLESDFKEVLKQEQSRKRLDAINMFYVASTRPTEQLQLFFTDDKDSKKYWNACKAISWSKDRVLIEEDNLIQIGENLIHDSIDSINKEDISINNFISNFWKDKIFLQRDISINMAIRNKGTQLHNILSEIDSDSNIKEVINKHVNGKTILQEYADEFEGIINKLLSNSETKYLFSSEHHFINEKEILDSNNKILKPDRVLISENDIVVIDYKYTSFDNLSDKEINKYKNQIKNYQEILFKIYNRKVRGVLLFLSPIKIVSF